MRRQVATENFLRAYEKFIRKHPDLVQKVEEMMDGLAADAAPIPSHRLRGNLSGFRTARISQSYRLIFALEPGIIVFIDIGSHDDVY